MARLQEIYKTEIMPKLKEELGVGSVMQVPKITKITIKPVASSLKRGRKHRLFEISSKYLIKLKFLLLEEILGNELYLEKSCL